MYHVVGIGVSTAGIVDQTGTIRYAGPTISNYQGTAIKSTLETKTNLPVNVVNDVDAALLGELLAGSAKDTTSAYCIALGTGIGGAFAINGKLYSGAHNNANSIGYTRFQPQTDTYFEQRAATLTLDTELAKLNVSVKDGFNLAKNGRQPYLHIIENWINQIATGIADILLVLDPEVLIIGGAVAQQGNYLLKLLNRALTVYIPADLFQTDLKTSKLANDAQLLGAISSFLK